MYQIIGVQRNQEQRLVATPIDPDAPNIVDPDGTQPSTIITDCSPQASQDDQTDGERPLPSANPVGGPIRVQDGFSR